MHYKKIGRQNMSNISAADFPRKQSNNSQSLLFEHWKWFAAAMTVVEPSAFSSDFPSFSIFFQSFWNHLNENDRRESKPPGNWGVDPHDGHEAFAFDSEIVRFQLCRCPDILRAFYTLTWQHCSKKRKMYSSKFCYNDKKGLRYFLGKTKWTTREKKWIGRKWETAIVERRKQTARTACKLAHLFFQCSLMTKQPLMHLSSIWESVGRNCNCWLPRWSSGCGSSSDAQHQVWTP